MRYYRMDYEGGPTWTVTFEDGHALMLFTETHTGWFSFDRVKPLCWSEDEIGAEITKDQFVADTKPYLDQVTATVA